MTEKSKLKAKTMVWHVLCIMFCLPLCIYTMVQGNKVERSLLIDDLEAANYYYKKVKKAALIMIAFWLFFLILAISGVLE